MESRNMSDVALAKKQALIKEINYLAAIKERRLNIQHHNNVCIKLRRKLVELRIINKMEGVGR